MVDENNPQNPQDDEFGAFPDYESDSFMEEDDFLAADREAPGDLDAPAAKPNLKEIWDQNPSLKIFAVISFLFVFLIAYMVFGSDDGDDNSSAVIQTGEVSQAPGTQELPPAYEEAVRQASEQRAELAAATGGSAIPTPIARPSERIEAPVQIEETDPLSEWRREAEERRNESRQPANVTPPVVENIAPLPTANQPNYNNFNQQQQPQHPPLPTGPTPEAVQAIAQQLQTQMQMVMETQVPKESVVVSMNVQPTYDMNKYFPPENQPGAAGGQQGQAGGNNAAATTPPKPKALIPAGTIAYGQVLTQANSDVPGPVLAEIASGPLMGGRALGQFSRTQRHLVLQFNRVVKDGVEYPVQAFALDPGTTLPGVVTDIDRHYFSRILLPAAARFIEGFSRAATQTDNSVVVVDGTVVSNTNDLNTRQELLNGADEAARQLSSVLEQDFGNRPITIRVAAGTRIGILFTSSVYDPAALQGLQPGQEGQYGQYGNQYNNQATGPSNFVGQMYNAYTGNTGYTPQQNASLQQYYQQQQQQQQTQQPARGSLPNLGSGLGNNFR